MIFAVIGIPFFLVAAGGVGEKIADRMRRGYNRLGFIDSEKYPKTAHFIKLIVMFLFSVVFYMVIPASIIQSIEDWSFGESLYYCFITLTTIGFGDYVPGENMFYIVILFQLKFSLSLLSIYAAFTIRIENDTVGPCF